MFLLQRCSWLNGLVVDVQICIPEKVLWLQRATTVRVNGLVVELKFSDSFLLQKYAWWSGLVVDMNKHRSEKVMWEVGRGQPLTEWFSGGAQIFGFVPSKKYCMVKWSSG